MERTHERVPQFWYEGYGFGISNVLFSLSSREGSAVVNHVIHWAQATREQLNQALPEALVVLPLGATEQHGPYLPTGTDIMVSSHVAELAAARAVERGSVPIILAPPLPFGISDHHRAYGGTLSMSSRTMLAVIEDLLDSVESQGGRRLLMVNGHGGNRGIARAAASAADARESITVAAVDYWDVDSDAAPGHAGSVETSLILAIAPELAATPIPARGSVPEIPSIGRAAFHGSWLWRSIDGYTDDPSVASAEEGHRLIETVVNGLADMMVAFGKLPA